MPVTIIRSAQATTGATNRQDLRGFATTASPVSTDPIAMGVTLCDADGGPLHATNALGSASITAGSTVTLVTVTVGAAPALYRLWGFRVWATGTGEPTDCKAWLEVGGVEIHADELFIARRVAEVRLPIPELLANGSALALKAYNRGATATFSGKVLGE